MGHPGRSFQCWVKNVGHALVLESKQSEDFILTFQAKRGKKCYSEAIFPP